MSEEQDPSEAQTSGVPRRQVPASASVSGEAAGQSIGRYRLLEKLGEGGMGTVWMAQQSEPVKRRVALKIIKLGMDTREVVARFEVERQALALMNHPHIAKVLDGGATEAGRPFFVMELVRGAPITEHCDQAKLGVLERLDLFVKVCGAIQHAHNKGIIHRDIKPTNILISMQDGVALPKVIDFGIAKATGVELAQETMFTKYAQVIGTPEYMAPEQAQTSALDIDTRADIYSLGVLLYELLTGTRPIDTQAALRQGYQELLRSIREVDPAKPSTRISSLGETASSIALKRQVDVRELNRGLRGDLDWIVMKALEKDRARRFETAKDFADDIGRFLRHEAVQAAPPSARYRLSRLLRRRKMTLLLAASVTLLVALGSIGTGLGWWRAKQAQAGLDLALVARGEALADEQDQRVLAQASEQRAKAATQHALGEKQLAREAEGLAIARADELQRVADFQAAQLSNLDVERMGEGMRAALLEAAPADLRAELGPDLAEVNFTELARISLRRNLFERTVETIQRQFAAQLLVQAQLLQSSARTLRELGLLDLASGPQERALELRRQQLAGEHPLTLVSLHELGLLEQRQGKLEAAEEHLQAALQGRRSVLGSEHPDTLLSLSSLGRLLAELGELELGARRFGEAQATLQAALELLPEELAEDDSEARQVQVLLGLASVPQAGFEASEGLLQEAAEWLFEHPEAMSKARGEGLLISLLQYYEAWYAAEPGPRPAGQVAIWSERLRSWRAEH